MHHREPREGSTWWETLMIVLGIALLGLAMSHAIYRTEFRADESGFTDGR